MAKNIVINYNTGLEYEELYPYTTPSFIGSYTKEETYSKEETEDSINERIKWTKFQTTQLTSASVSSDLEVAEQIFPGNSWTDEEDVMVIVNGTISLTFLNTASMSYYFGIQQWLGFPFGVGAIVLNLFANSGTSEKNITANLNSSFAILRIGLNSITSTSVYGVSTSTDRIASYGIQNTIPLRTWRESSENDLTMLSNLSAPSNSIYFVGILGYNSGRQPTEYSFAVDSINLTFDLYKRPAFLGYNELYQ